MSIWRYAVRRILILFGMFIFTCTITFAAKIPEEVVDYIQTNVPGADIRFDGVIILPDNTVYLPLYPSLFSDIKTLSIKESIPANQDIKSRPNVIIFNNDFVLLKVLVYEDGKKTVMHIANPPLQVRTGLLPQDMLVPSGLILPENLKGIKGNLNIDTKSEDIIKLNIRESFEEFLSENNKIPVQSLIPQLNNKMVYITTNYSKNIQVLDPAKASPVYSLAQKSIPICVQPVKNGKFLMVTSYERPFVDIVSIADSRFIKQIPLGTNPDRIILDEANNKAYVTAPKSSVIFVIDLNIMTVVQKIRINGYCENLILAENKIFYTDKMKNEIWAIETDNDYILKSIGKIHNISALAYNNGKLYITSRTRNRLAVVNYETLGLEHEYLLENKPVAMLNYKNLIYILTAQNNVIQIYNTETETFTGKIQLPQGGFSTELSVMPGTNYAITADVKLNNYSIIDLSNGSLVKTYYVNIPVKEVKIADKIRLFD